jgi:hypothetical protein
MGMVKKNGTIGFYFCFAQAEKQKKIEKKNENSAFNENPNGS